MFGECCTQPWQYHSSVSSVPVDSVCHIHDDAYAYQAPGISIHPLIMPSLSVLVRIPGTIYDESIIRICTMIHYYCTIDTTQSIVWVWICRNNLLRIPSSIHIDGVTLLLAVRFVENIRYRVHACTPVCRTLSIFTGISSFLRHGIYSYMIAMYFIWRHTLYYTTAVHDMVYLVWYVWSYPFIVCRSSPYRIMYYMYIVAY